MSLPRDFEENTHAVKTSIESFIIIHQQGRPVRALCDA